MCSALQGGERAPVTLGAGLVEAAENHLGDAAGAGQGFGDGFDGDFGGFVGRIAEDAGRDRREGDGGEGVLLRYFQRAAVAGSEELGLAAAAALPDRADGWASAHVARWRRRRNGRQRY